ncbi:MAG: hypothetical protein NC182_00115 [Prevotella sp.]|nr:hypothetical protein [Staphylococcus sp.]MCM1349589.1 hypothetical protein [Prevotella sp.]
MKQCMKKLKTFDWKLFIALSILALFPAIYQMIRTALISTSISTEAFDVIGQMEWFDLINETLQAFLIVPLYATFNPLYKEGKNFQKCVFQFGIVVFCLYLLFSIGVFIYGKYLILAMNPEMVNLHMVNQYLQLETIAFSIGILISFVNVIFVVVGKSKNMYIMLIVNCLLLIVSDFLLIPHWGINGVALSNVVTNCIMVGVGIVLLYLNHLFQIGTFNKDTLMMMKSWSKIGLFSGMQVLIDNLVYALMVCKMVNMVSEQGNYWNANNFIWGWLLIPITALSEIIKKDCKEEDLNLKQQQYHIITVGVCILWVLTIPLWYLYYKYCNRLDNYTEVFLITLKLCPFYIAYAFAMIPDSIFIGRGKTRYNFINSLIINIGYYGIFYILYQMGILTMNMNVIILMFGLGMVVHFGVSVFQKRMYFKQVSYVRNVDNTINYN